MKDVKLQRDDKSGRFTLTSQRGEKISAVEGLKLSPRMGKILEQSSRAGMTGDQRRELIKEQARKK